MQRVFVVAVLAVAISAGGFSQTNIRRLTLSKSELEPLAMNREFCSQGRSLTITQLDPKRSGPRSSYTNGSGLKDRLRVVIRNREAWVEMWKRIYSQQPTDEVMAMLPEVDFSREMLIVAALGERPTGGYGIIVSSACEREKELEIVVRSISRVRCGGVTQSLTQPLDIGRLPKSELPVVFREIEVDDCEIGMVSVSINDLRKLPTKVVLDGRSLSLSAYLWRDFMPGTGLMIDGRPMIAVLKVATSDKKSFPSGVRIDRAWVLFGEQMWETSDFREQLEGSPNHKDSGKWINCPDSPVCEAVARGGPKWGPGVFVDVVVQLTDKEGRHHLLQAPKQYVERTD